MHQRRRDSAGRHDHRPGRHTYTEAAGPADNDTAYSGLAIKGISFQANVHYTFVSKGQGAMAASFDDLRCDLTAGREHLLAAIAGVSEEQFKRRPPAPGGEPNWSIAEILSHLLYSERLWATGIALAITQNRVKIQAGSL